MILHITYIKNSMFCLVTVITGAAAKFSGSSYIASQNLQKEEAGEI